jgi:hypothetical protein
MTQLTQSETQLHEEPLWASLIPNDQWQAYLKAIRVARATNAPFMLGGAFALAHYVERLRNTKDLDFFVLPQDKDEFVDALTKAGFEDYFPTLAYDRGWIYRAVLGETLVDIIWQTPNRRSVVDEEWLKRVRTVNLKGEELMVMPAEELLCIKLYVMQRDRCDWPDLINLLYSCGDHLDWNHVIARMHTELPLLTGLLHVFNWVAPAKAAQLPEWVRERFHLANITSADLNLEPRHRIELLDTRPWFASFQPADKPMQL